VKEWGQTGGKDKQGLTMWNKDGHASYGGNRITQSGVMGGLGECQTKRYWEAVNTNWEENNYPKES